MKIIESEGYLVVTRVSGPYHHYLGVRFTAAGSPSNSILVTDGATPSLAACGHRPVPVPARIVEEVEKGVREESRRLGVELSVAAIRYCSTDPSLEGIYSLLAKSIVEHVVSKSPRSLAEGQIDVPNGPSWITNSSIDEFELFDDFLMAAANERFQELYAFEHVA